MKKMTVKTNQLISKQQLFGKLNLKNFRAGDTHISLQPQSVHSPEQKYDTEPTSVKMRKSKRNPDNSHFDFLCRRAELGADVCWPLPFSELSNGETPQRFKL